MPESFRVLVVDDAADAADALACALSLDGYDVKVASEGQEALSIAGEFQPLCVLLDVEMPGMDGLALARELRARHGAGMVLIAVTGWGDEGLRVSEDFSHFDHYLRKPVPEAMLRKLLPPID